MAKKKVKSIGRKFALSLGLIFSMLTLMFSLATGKVLAAIAVVSPSSMQGWAFEIQSPDGFGTFVAGPSTPPLGSGSVRLFSGTNGNSSIAFYNVSYNDFKLIDVTRLDHWGYASTMSGASVNQPFMYIDLSTGVGSDTLIFDPNAQANSATLNAWQNWNTKESLWTSTRFSSQFILSDYISFVNGIDANDILITGIRFQVGPASTLDVFDGYADGFTIGINGGDITYNFEPDAAPSPTPLVSPTPSPSPTSMPTDKEQCKNGGWNTFRNPTFKNQGDCISFVNKQK